MVGYEKLGHGEDSDKTRTHVIWRSIPLRYIIFHSNHQKQLAVSVDSQYS